MNRPAAIILGIILMSTTAVQAKSGRTYYTDERIAAARENVEKYEWAQKLVERIKRGDGFRYYIGPIYGPADRYIEQTDDFMWLLQPTTEIGRVVPKESKAHDPEFGIEAQKVHVWCPYNIDPINHPYKVQSMLSKKWYPSNDYHLGDMTSGEWPDDGEGIVCPGGWTVYALREYAHMVYGSAVIPALRSLSELYLVTGDERYARKGAILLARVATQYPNQTDRIDRMYFAQYGMRSPQYAWKTGGRISDLIWETFLSEAAILAYDALYDYLGEDPTLIEFLKGKDMPIENADDLRKYIERYLVGSVMEGLLDGSIHGNEGFHQSAAMTCALVFDRYDDVEPNSTTMVNWAFHGEGRSAYMLENNVLRDGGGHESPNYNKIKLDFVKVNRLMEQVRKRQPGRFAADRYPDLFAGEKARRLFDFFIDVVAQDVTMPAIGDSGGITDKVRRRGFWTWSYLREENIYAFDRYGDPRFARAATNEKGEVYAGELFEPYPAERIAAALKDPASKITRESRLLDSYGLAFLEAGEGDDRRTAILNYTSMVGHRQLDDLTLELVIRGVDLLPDLGYPRTWNYCAQWDANSLTHNTVTVDETQPAYSYGGICRLFAVKDGVHAVTASHDPYRLGGVELGNPDAKPCDLFERTVVMVNLDAQRAYVVDLFVVNGGEQHDQSWHAFLKPATLPELNWKDQAGTIAGSDVEMYGEWTDRWGRKRDDAFSFMTHVRRATLDKPATWTWDTGLEEGDKLRLHIVPVGGPAEVIQADGKSSVRPDDWWLPYTYVRHQVKDGAVSQFVTVLESSQGEPVIRAVRVVDKSPLTLEVEHATGTDRITLHAPLTSSSHTKHRALGVRVESGGKDVRIGAAGPGYHPTRIHGLDYDAHTITIDDDPAVQSGAPIRIFNHGRSAMYRVESVEREGGRATVTLDATALVGRGPVTDVSDGRMDMDISLVFATGRFDDDGNFVPGCAPHTRDTELEPGWDRLAGAWVIGNGKAYRTRGATRRQIGPDGNLEPGTKVNALILEDPVPAAELEAAFAGKVITIWQYAVGDEVEIARVQSGAGI